MATKHWKRRLTLTVGGFHAPSGVGTVGGLSGVLEGGQKDDQTGGTVGTGLVLDDLMATFQVRHAFLQQPGHCYIRIINLSDATSASLMMEGAAVTLSGGYHEGPYGQIFLGELREARRGKMNGTDKYFDLLAIGNATQGHSGYVHAAVSETLKPNATVKDWFDAALRALAPYGISRGYVDDLGDKSFPRGITINEPARDVLRTIAETMNMRWTVFGGRLHMVKNDGSIPGSTTIGPDSGLIGVPEQTLKGVNLRILLNPNIRIGQMIRLDSSVNEYFDRGDTGIKRNIENLPGSLPGISPMGEYRVEKIEHDGTTLGQEWYTTLTCVDPKNPGLSAKRNASGLASGVPETDTSGSSGGGGS